MDEEPRFRRRVGAQAAGAIERRNRGTPALRAGRDELLLVDEPHRPQVLPPQRRRAIAAIRELALDQGAEERQPLIARSALRGADECGHTRSNGWRDPRGGQRRAAQKRGALVGRERVDQRLRAERGLDRRQRRKSRRLEEVENQVIEIAFSDALHVGVVHALHVGGKGVRGEARCLKLAVQGGDILPRNIANRRAPLDARNGRDGAGNEKRHRQNSQLPTSNSQGKPIVRLGEGRGNQIHAAFHSAASSGFASEFRAGSRESGVGSRVRSGDLEAGPPIVGFRI